MHTCVWCVPCSGCAVTSDDAVAIATALAHATRLQELSCLGAFSALFCTFPCVQLSRRHDSWCVCVCARARMMMHCRCRKLRIGDVWRANFNRCPASQDHQELECPTYVSWETCAVAVLWHLFRFPLGVGCWSVCSCVWSHALCVSEQGVGLKAGCRLARRCGVR